MDDLHVLAADDIRRAQEDRVTQFAGGAEGAVQRFDAGALRPFDVEFFEEGVEPFAVLRRVDAPGGRAKDLDAVVIKELRERDGGLAAEGHDDTDRLLDLDDVHDVFRRQGLEVQAVRGVVVRGDRLRVVVDDDDVVAQLFERPDAVDRGVVELDALSDADGARAEDHDGRLAGTLKGAGLAMFVVGRIEVRCGGREFRGAGVDHFIDRVPVEDAGHAEARGTGQAAQGIVRVTEFLAFFVEFLGEAVLETVFELHEVPEFVEEPAVDLRDLEDLVDRDAGLQGLEDREHPEVVDSGEAFLDGCPVHRVPIQGVHVDLRAADRLQHRHLEARADGHDFTGGLHLGAQFALCVRELVEGPLRELDDDVVEGRLEAGTGLARDVVFDLIEVVPEGDLGRDLRDGVTGGLGGQRGGPGDAGVHFDDGIFKGVRVQRELTVAAADDVEGGDDVQGRGPEHLVLFVRQGLGGCHDDGVAGVDADRVEVLHGADRDDVAGIVAHRLELDLLPAGDALFDEDLVDGRRFQARVGDELQFVRIVRDTAAGAAEGEGRTHDDGVPDVMGDVQRGSDIFRNV